LEGKGGRKAVGEVCSNVWVRRVMVDSKPGRRHAQENRKGKGVARLVNGNGPKRVKKRGGENATAHSEVVGDQMGSLGTGK